jgi:hypothetical protein
MDPLCDQLIKSSVCGLLPWHTKSNVRLPNEDEPNLPQGVK